jgi:V/A-type H+-transporting ATPase subunit I
MRRLDVVAPRRDARRLLRALHRTGAVHLAPIAEEDRRDVAFRRPGGVADPLARAAASIAELRRAIVAPDAPRALVADLWELDDAGLVARVGELAAVQTRAAELEAERVRLTAARTRSEGYRSLIDGLQTIVDRLPAIQGYAATAIVVQARYRAVLGLLREELEELTGGRCEVMAADLSNERVGAALLYPQRQAAEVRSLLGGKDLEEVPLPDEFAGLPFTEIERRLVAGLEAAEARTAELEAELVDLGRRHGAQVAALEAVLRDRAAESAALAEALESEHLVVVSGWVPADRVEEVRRTVEAELGPAAAVVERPLRPGEEREAPVAFQNRSVLRPFEELASFVSVPRYGSLDPTPYVAMTLPVFVGLMVGDVGYGLVLLALLALAKRRWPRSSVLSRALPIGVLAGVSTIAFGFLFGELFGEAGARAVGLHPVWLDRREATVEFLVLAIAIGAAQVVVGLVLGMLNALLLRSRSMLLERVAMLVGLVAVALVLGWLAGPLPAALGYLGAAALVAAVAVLVATLGLAGPIELVGTVGNILSYARLMAIGLASVMLAVVANELGALTDNLLVGGLVALLLHSLNIALGFFDSSIQGLRLHYVEFFSKFVVPGGVRFAPFTSALAGGGAGLRPEPAGG